MDRGLAANNGLLAHCAPAAPQDHPGAPSAPKHTVRPPRAFPLVRRRSPRGTVGQKTGVGCHNALFNRPGIGK